MKRVIFSTALAVSAFAGFLSIAHAEDGTMRVKLGGIDLSTPAGAHIALARIRLSADAFCDVRTGRESLERIGVENRCVAAMTRKSVEQLHAPLVTALFDKESTSPAALALAEK